MTEGWGKSLFFGALHASGITRLWAKFARGVPILAYHGVTARADDALRNRRRLHVPATVFAQQLDILSREWRPVPLSTFLSALAEQRPLPPRSVVVTFDDGYRNVGTVAAPLLRQFGIPFTLFIVTSSVGGRLWLDQVEASIQESETPLLYWRGHRIALGTANEKLRAVRNIVHILEDLGEGRDEAIAGLWNVSGRTWPADDDRDLLDWNEIRELRDTGVEIGCHSDRHEPVTWRPAATLRVELADCHGTLRKQLGPKPYPFCYPYGAWNSASASAVRDAGFTCGLTTDAGLNDPRQDCFALLRNLVGADDQRTRLLTSLSGLRALWMRSRG